MNNFFSKLIFIILLAVHVSSYAAEGIPYMVLYTGKDNHSYLKEAERTLNPAKIGSVTGSVAVSNVFFGKGAAETQDWHNAPQRLFIIILSGIMQIETSSGQIKDFKAGDVLLAEDLTGRGHITRALNKQPVQYLAMMLKNEKVEGK